VTSDYDRLRQQLDDQLRADIEMIYAASLADMQRVYTAYLARLRAAETLAGGQGGADGRPALDLGSVFPAFLGQAVIPLAVAPVLPPGPAAAALPPGPAAALPPAPAAPAPAAKRRRSKTPNHEVYDAVVAVLDQVPEVFDRNDLLRLLPIKPHRSTLFRILQVLVYQDKVIVHVEGTGYGSPNRYRKVAPPPAG
jgi:hypothetical protein